MSPDERAAHPQSRRRRPRRRGGRGQRHAAQEQPGTPSTSSSESTVDRDKHPGLSAHSAERKSDSTQTGAKNGSVPTPKPRPKPPAPATAGQHRSNRGRRLRTVRETSAGGLVITGWEGGRDKLRAALIGRLDRRGRLLWSLPKGHIERGETAEQTAMREVAEETGIQGRVLASLGSIDYWFVTEGRRVHKTVHHFLMRFLGGELSDADLEVSEVAWVPLSELDSRLAYADERKLARLAAELIASMASSLDGLRTLAADAANAVMPDHDDAGGAANTDPAEHARPRKPPAGRPAAQLPEKPDQPST